MSVKVLLRCKPSNSRSQNLFELQGQTILEKKNNSSFSFHSIYDESKSTQEIQQEFVDPIVDACVEGYHGTIFAYGQTGSGKTHTMTGTSTELGIIPLSVDRVFKIIESDPTDKLYLVNVAYFEIYREKITDLLVAEKGAPKYLDIKEDQNKEPFVAGLTEVQVRSKAEVLSAFESGNLQRKTGSTAMNEKSSRSHSVFRLTVESKDALGALSMSHLNLVDLAGSEKMAQTKAEGQRLKEGIDINQSLFQLNSVIMQITQGAEYVSYRNSKLTRILQNSLGGTAKTCIVCTVSLWDFEETVSTLRFATAAKIIKNEEKKNELIPDTAMIKRLEARMKELESELANIGGDNEQFNHATENRDKLKQMKEFLLKEDQRNIASTITQTRDRRQTWAPRSRANRLSTVSSTSSFRKSRIPCLAKKPQVLIKETAKDLNATNTPIASKVVASATLQLHVVEEEETNEANEYIESECVKKCTDEQNDNCIISESPESNDTDDSNSNENKGQGFVGGNQQPLVRNKKESDNCGDVCDVKGSVNRNIFADTHQEMMGTDSGFIQLEDGFSRGEVTPKSLNVEAGLVSSIEESENINPQSCESRSPVDLMSFDSVTVSSSVEQPVNVVDVIREQEAAQKAFPSAETVKVTVEEVSRAKIEINCKMKEAIKRKIVDLQTQKNNREKRIKDAVDKLMKPHIDNHCRNKEVIKKKIADLQKQTNDRNLEDNQNCIKLQSEIETLQQHKMKLREKLEEEKQRNEKYKNDIKMGSPVFSEEARAIEELDMKLEVIGSKKREEIETKMKELETTINNLKKTNDEFSKKKECLEFEFKEKLRANSSYNDRNLNDYQKQMIGLKQLTEIKSRRLKVRAEIPKLQEQIAEGKKELEAVKKQVEEKEKSIGDIKGQILSIKMRAATESLQRKKTEVVDLRALLKRQSNEINNLKEECRRKMEENYAQSLQSVYSDDY